MTASVRWHPEEQRRPDGSVRQVQAAWLVAQDAETPSKPRYLAYLGNHPRVTRQLQEECQFLYPEVEVDWRAVARALEQPPPLQRLDLESLARHWTDAASAQGHDPMEVEARIGGGRQHPLSDLARLLADPAVVGRIERTSGSILAYMLEFHADYAYALAKLALLLAGRHDELEQLEADEAARVRGARRSAQVAFWRAAARRVVDTLAS